MLKRMVTMMLILLNNHIRYPKNGCKNTFYEDIENTRYHEEITSNKNESYTINFISNSI